MWYDRLVYTLSVDCLKLGHTISPTAKGVRSSTVADVWVVGNMHSTVDGSAVDENYGGDQMARCDALGSPLYCLRREIGNSMTTSGIRFPEPIRMI